MPEQSIDVSHVSPSCLAENFLAALSSNLSQGYADLLEQILLDCRSRRRSEATSRTRVYAVGVFFRWLQGYGLQALNDVQPSHVQRYFAEDQRSRNTVALATSILRHYLAAFGRADLSGAVPRVSFRFRDDYEVFSEDEVARMLACTDNRQWQLRLLMLWETGAREGELCALRMRDVRLDGYGGIVTLRGKTKPRPRRLIKSVKLLEAYVREHPWAGDPDAAFFYAERGKRRESLRTQAFLRVVKVLAKRAGIGRRVWGHLVRHSAATSEASDFTDAELEELYGWEKGSRMPERYRHKIDAHRLEMKQLRLAGIQIPEEETRSPLAPRICPRCSEQNSVTARVCVRCSMILDSKLAREITVREEKAKSILNILCNDQEFFDLMVRKIREKGLDQG